MTITQTLSDQRGMLMFTLTGGVSVANGGLGEVANPEGVTLGILRAFVYYRTGSTGAANLSAGVAASGAAATDLINAQDVIQATVGGKLMHEPAVQVAKTEVPTAKWTSTTYLTFTGSADTTGLDADVFVEYIRLA